MAGPHWVFQIYLHLVRGQGMSANDASKLLRDLFPDLPVDNILGVLGDTRQLENNDMNANIRERLHRVKSHGQRDTTEPESTKPASNVSQSSPEPVDMNALIRAQLASKSKGGQP